jgi:hypothetical protein
MASDKNVVRALAFGWVMAAMAFCYATATDVGSRAIGAAAQPEARAVGSSPLRFTNPLLAVAAPPALNTYDLGDAFFGSTITRYVTVTGGVRPYHFAANGLTTPNLAANSTLQLYAAGLMLGSIGAGSASPLVFTVFTADTYGTVAHAGGGTFIINTFNYAPGTFRFAVDRINNGVLGQSYLSKLETLGGNQPVVFSVMPNTLQVNGVSLGISTGLEPIGLSLAQDGTIFGKPLTTGNISFTAHAVDGLKRVATGRTSAAADQVITFSVEDTSVSATDYTTLSCTIKGDLGKAGKDSIKFTGVMNLAGFPVTTLNGIPFAFRVGGASYEGRINGKGKIVNAQGGPLIFASGAAMKAQVDPRSGLLKGSVSRATLGTTLNAQNILDRSTVRLAVQTIIASSQTVSFTGIQTGAACAEMIDFASRKKGNKFQLDYKLGNGIGQPLGGAFQVLSVRGDDRQTISGTNGDAWTVRFLAVPRFGVDATPGLDAIGSVGVRIGSRFEQRLTQLASTGKGSVKLNVTKTLSPVVIKFQMDTRKFVGTVQTNPIAELVTGIPTAFGEAYRVGSVSGTGFGPNDTTTTAFTFGLDIDRTGTNSDFSGEVGKQIYLPAQRKQGWSFAGPVANTQRKAKTYWVDRVNQR